MHGSSDLADIVGTIFEATIRPEAWNDVCDRIAEHSRATTFMIFDYDLEAHQSPRFYGSEWTRNDGKTLVQTLLAGSAPEDAGVYERIANFPAGRLVPEFEIWNVGHDLEIPTNKFRDMQLEAAGSKSRNAARINDIGPWMDIAALHMPCYGVDVPRDTFSDLNFLLPVIRKALETSRVVRNLTSQFGLLLEAFDLLDFGAAFCAPDGRILIANRHMRDMIDDRDGVASTGGGNILEAAVTDDRDPLRSVLAAAVRPDTPPNGLWLQLHRRSGKSPLIAKAAPVRARELGNPADQVVLLLLADPEDDGRVHAEGLAAFGLLSPAELDVCRWLLKGAETGEIAERRSTSIETTRNQIKSAAAKMACRTRLDLLRLAMATSLPKREEG